jgi:drug/metabolite transporter (DMT)-like permease
VLSRLFAAVPTDTVAGFCLATAALSTVCHLLFEQTLWPQTAVEWGAVIALGIGPVGGAFFAWDVGIKHGDIRVLGAASYLAPLLSTAFLVLAGYAQAGIVLALAALLIAAGGLIAAKNMILGKR